MTQLLLPAPKQSTNRHLLGVYGTLRLGGSNHKNYLAEGIYVKNQRIRGILLDINGWYPAAVLSNRVPDHHACKKFVDEHDIVIEIYDISEDMLDKIDGLEGHPDYYQRTLVPVPLLGHVWVYNHPWEWHLKGEQYVVQSGDWHAGAMVKAVKFGDGTEKPHVLMLPKGLKVDSVEAPDHHPNSIYYSKIEDADDEEELHMKIFTQPPWEDSPVQTDIIVMSPPTTVKEA